MGTVEKSPNRQIAKSPKRQIAKSIWYFLVRQGNFITFPFAYAVLRSEAVAPNTPTTLSMMEQFYVLFDRFFLAFDAPILFSTFIYLGIIYNQ